MLLHHSLKEIEQWSTGEFNLYMDAVEYSKMEEMEKIRMLVYPTFAVNSKKKLKLTDVMRFDWDNKHTVENISNDKKNEMLEKMKGIEGRLNKGELKTKRLMVSG